MKLSLEITTPERVVLKEEVDQVSLPTVDGEITVLPHHLPLVSVLKAGEVKIVRNGKPEFMAVSGGFVQVQPDRVVVLADTAERAHEIDVERAQAGRERAKTLLAEKQFDAKEYATISAKLEKELTRVRVARRKHHRVTLSDQPNLTQGEE